MPINVLPLQLKQTFPPIIWIITEGDGIESRLPFKIFSTLCKKRTTCLCMYPGSVWSIIIIGPYLKLIIQDFPFSSRVASIGFLWTKMIWQCENHGTNFVIKIQKFALKQQKWLTHYLMSKVSHSIYIRTFKILQLRSQMKFTLTQTNTAVKKLNLLKKV